MAEVEITISSAKDLENVNWRYGPIRPYAVVWVDPKNKLYTRIDEGGHISPCWDETLTIRLLGPIDYDNTSLYIAIFHAGNEEDTEKLIGSARLGLGLQEIFNGTGYGERAKLTLQLKRPSGEPRGMLDVKLLIRDPGRAQGISYGATQPGQGMPYCAAQPPPANLYCYQASSSAGYPPPANLNRYEASPSAGYPPPANVYCYQATPSAGYPPTANVYCYQASPSAGYPNAQAPKKNKLEEIVDGASNGLNLGAAFNNMANSAVNFLGGY